jgi:hypothetical protein
VDVVITEEDYRKYVEDLAQAAIESATTDGVDEWNQLVDVYNQTPQEVLDRLARR